MAEEKLKEKISNERLTLIFDWYRGMASQKTGRLVYIYHPKMNSLVTDGSPIREIASLWDMEILSEFLNRRELESIIVPSLHYYSHYLIKRDGHVILDPDLLDEPSSIAHSAFMLLAFIHSRMPDRKEKVFLLADGIPAQQRSDGSYKIYFGPEPDDGLDFYPGEAMLALLETYKLTHEKKYLESVERGFDYYKNEYYEKNRVEPDLLVFFANWQSQFCRLLYQETQKQELKDRVKDYLFELHDRIIEQDFYERVIENPGQQVSVEVACALEGLNEAYAIAVEEKDHRTAAYQRALCISLAYLSNVQCVRICTERERGGFGFSLSDRTQRIDVTGHFVNGMIKSLRNGVVC
jgi:hypothetical protein